MNVLNKIFICFICLVVVIKILIPDAINKLYKPIPLMKLSKKRKTVFRIIPIKLSYITSLALLVACKNVAKGASI